MVTFNLSMIVQNTANKNRTSLNSILPLCTWHFGWPRLLTLDGSPQLSPGVQLPMNVPMEIRSCSPTCQGSPMTVWERALCALSLSNCASDWASPPPHGTHWPWSALLHCDLQAKGRPSLPAQQSAWAPPCSSCIHWAAGEGPAQAR